MEGVIHAVNAQTPEFVPFSTLSANVNQWNGRPLMLNHPVRDGVHVAANDPLVLEEQSFGSVFNARVDDKQRRLLMDAYVDPERLKTLNRLDVLQRVEEGGVIEVSVGAFVTTDPTPGVYNGKPYKASWKALGSDHLAFLPDTRGACSVEMGCGAHRAAEELEVLEVDEPTLIERITSAVMEVLGGKGSGNFDHEGRPGKVGGSGDGDGDGGGGSKKDKAMARADEYTKGLRKKLERVEGTGKTSKTPQLHDVVTYKGQKHKVSGIEGWSGKLSISPLHPDGRVDHTGRMKAVRPEELDDFRSSASKDCPMCQGSGSYDGNPCEVCDGTGEIKVAETKEKDMDRQALITKLTTCSCSGFTKDDVKMLEAASDERLQAFVVATDAAMKKKEDEEKMKEEEEEKVKAAAAKAKADEDAKRTLEQQVAELKAASEKTLTEDEFLKRAPESIRTLVADKKAQDEAERTALTTSLKAASAVFNEDELKAMDLPQLRKMAALAKVDQPDYSGRGLPVIRTATSAFAPPDPYKAALEARQKQVQ